MTKFMTLLLLLLGQELYSQKLIINGNAKSYDLEDSGKIYYTEEGKQFDEKNFIEYGIDGNFVFTMDVSKIKKDAIKVLVFSLSNLQKSDDKNACVHRINIGNIVASSKIKKSKPLSIKTDLFFDLNCEASEYYDAKEENEERFVGRYQFELNDTVRIIELKNIFYRYISSLSPQNKEYMSQEFGSWDYNPQEKVLKFIVWRQENPDYGLIIEKRYQFEFIVEENDTSINLIHKAGGTIIRL